MKEYIFLLVLLSATASVQADNDEPISAVYTNESNDVAQVISQKSDSELKELLINGKTLLIQKSPKRAIDESFNIVIQKCEEQYDFEKSNYFTARSLDETLYYLAKASDSDTKKDTFVIKPYCSEALYYKSYANIELGQLDAAEASIKKAVELSPMNSIYLSELGHIYELKKDWKKALEVYNDSEKWAEISSPAELKDDELARAKRGVGYILIELGRLDEAETKFMECLAMNKNDKSALNELMYIEGIRAKAK